MTNSVVFSFNMSKNLKVSCDPGQADVKTYTLASKITPFVENKGVEPLTPCVQGRCSGQLS